MKPTTKPGRMSHSTERMRRRAALTLIEIMIGLTMTLIVLGAMMVAFRYASEEVAKGRAMIMMSNQLRATQALMRADLAGLTVDVRPNEIMGTPNGYLEYIEGALRDNSFALSPNNAFGDLDDILALTTRTAGAPYVGRQDAGGGIVNTIESNVAEVVWWPSFEDRNNNGNLDADELPTVRVHRRQLLIRPDLSPVPAVDVAAVRRFFLLNDISARWDVASGQLIPNSLADLARRENRFAHAELVIGAANQSPNYPHLLSRAFLRSVELTEANLSITGDPRYYQYAGQDIVLTGLLAFDIKIFSPNSPILGSTLSSYPLTPDGLVYNPANPATPAIDSGIFVDLGYLGVPFNPLDLTIPQFSTLPMIKFAVIAPGNDIPYCTFSPHYEFDGLNQPGFPGIDPAANGLDDDGVNGVDDDGERETSPPYPFPVRGLQIKFRLLEPNTKQVRESVVVESFLPR